MGDSPTISQRIAESITRQISEGTLRPGDRLPPERELAMELGVARSPLREALRELKAQGLLESGKGRQRTVVASASARSIRDPLANLLQAGTGRFSELIELRQGLEVQAAGLAARRRCESDMQAFREILTAMQLDKHDDTNKSAGLDAAFHGTLANATHNVFFMHVTGQLVRLLHENIPGILDILYADEESSQMLLQQHTAIARAIEAGAEEEARNAVRDHLTYVQKGLASTGAGESDGRDAPGLPGPDASTRPHAGEETIAPRFQPPIEAVARDGAAVRAASRDLVD